MPETEAERQFLDKRLDTISWCAKEAVRREVEKLRARNLPIYVAENGKVVDLNSRPSTDANQQQG